MTMIVRLIFFLLFIFNLQADEKPFILLTVPKTGTHLVHNLISELTKSHKKFIANPNILPAYRPKQYYFSHFKTEFDPNAFKRNYPGVRFFYNIRDPRDVVISSIYYYSRVLDGILGAGASFDDRLSFTIKHKEMNGYLGVLLHYKRALNAIRKGNELVLRFEDLVGPKGGGTAEQQVYAIQQVANFLHINISDSEALKIGDRIYGHSATFRSGKTGSWRNHFKPHHIIEFKQSGLQQMLVEFGYEKDDQWN